MALLLRISDQARRPLPDDDSDALPEPALVGTSTSAGSAAATQVQAPVRRPAAADGSDTEVVDVP